MLRKPSSSTTVNRMLQQLIRFHATPWIDGCIKWLIAVALQVLLGPVVLDLKGEVPITMQSLAVLFGAIAFGWRIGTLATITYILAGAIGFPIFAGHHAGMRVIIGPHGGFFFGFLAASIICGYLAETRVFGKPATSILNWLLGHIIILLFGGMWLMQLDPEGWTEKLGSLLTGALVKSAFGALLIQLILRFMQGKNPKRAFEDSETTA